MRTPARGDQAGGHTQEVEDALMVPHPVVHVWWSLLTAARSGLRDLLPENERRRTTEPLPPADEGRRLLAAALLQHAVTDARTGHGAGSTPGSARQPVPVDRTCDTCGEQHGRPVIPGGPQVSVSHAGVVVVVAVCGQARIGVDVERADRVLDESPHGPDVRSWTVREAAFKAGLDVGTDPVAQAALADMLVGSAVVDLEPPRSGYLATLVVRARPAPAVHVHHWP